MYSYTQIDKLLCCIIFLQISEVSQVVDVSELEVVGSTMLIIWKWEWFTATDDEHEFESSSDDERTEIMVVPETPPPESSDCESDTLQEASASLSPHNHTTYHTVTFKCIGCHKEVRYQQALERAYQLRSNGTLVPCKFQPEPNNPYDSQAIAFFCKLNKWEKIGYAVKEVLAELHDAIARNEITNVRIKWIKYVIHWQSPGWYAGIDVTRNGEWSHTVLRSQSARI